MSEKKVTLKSNIETTIETGMFARSYSFDLQIGYIYLILPISFTFMFLVSIELITNHLEKLISLEK